MTKNKLGRFQLELWKQAAAEGNLRSVLDAADAKGRKNTYIDTLHKRELAGALNLRGDEVILDFGSGVGRISSWLAPRCRKVIGIDVTPAMVQKASETNLRQNVEYRLYDGINIPSEKEYFDCLTSVYVLQHVTAEEDFLKLADEFRRVLKPGAKACLIEQVSASLSHEEGTPDDFNLRRAPSHYVDVFDRNGFDCHERRLIRTSSASVWLAEQWFFPSFLFSTLAAAEALISRFRKLSHLKYADCLLVFVKKQGDKA